MNFTTVSTGLLVFPTAEGMSGFANLQTQAMSLYLLRWALASSHPKDLAHRVTSTITSQIALTFGGSLFPGALGSMLIEILPFLRNIASSIQDVLGYENPSLLPTVMAAYAMTSFLIGAVFVALGVLRCGRLVCLYHATLNARS